MPGVRDGKYDAGLVIHEARFTYPDYGLMSMVDLGAWWEADTGLPIPLGAILAKRELDADALAAGGARLGRVRLGQPARLGRVHRQARRRDGARVQRRHIDLYVNEFTRDLGDEGYAAISALLDRAYAAGLTPSAPSLR